MRITRLKKSSKPERYIITGDWHSKYCCEKTVQKLLRYGTKAMSLVINGDFLDAEPLMKKNVAQYLTSTHAIEEKLLPQLDEEIAWGNDMLDKLGKVFKHIYFLAGNHEIRYNECKNLFPSAYRHHFDYTTRLRLSERNIPFVEYNDFLQIGKLRVSHGIYHGQNHLKKHQAVAGATDIVVGHLHRHEILATEDADGVKKAISLPCMREIDAHYLKNKPTNWSKGFIQATVAPEGHVHYLCYEMKNEKIYLANGKEL